MGLVEVRPESSFLKDQVHSTLGLTLWVQTLYTQVALPLLVMGCEIHYYIPKCLIVWLLSCKVVVGKKWDSRGQLGEEDVRKRSSGPPSSLPSPRTPLNEYIEVKTEYLLWKGFSSHPITRPALRGNFGAAAIGVAWCTGIDVCAALGVSAGDDGGESLQGSSWVLETQWRAEATCEVWVWSKDREEFPRVPCRSQWAQAGREWWLTCSSLLLSPTLLLQPLCFGLFVGISWSVLFLCLWWLSLSKMVTSSIDGTGNGFSCTCKAQDKCFPFLSDGSQWQFHMRISYSLSQKAGSGSFLILFSCFQLNSH